MTVDDAAGEAMRELKAAALGTVVAVWRSGEVSAHRNLGFRHRTLPDGSREEPITSFVKDSRRWSLSEIQGRIERALSLQRGDTADTAYLKELMDNGSYVGMDRFGMDFLLSFEDRVNTVASLCKDGYAGRVVLSHDASCCLDWIADRAVIDQMAPDWNFNHIPDKVVPALLQRGVSQQQVDQMLINNPRTIFERQGAY